MWHQYFTTTFYIFPGNRFNIRWFTPPNEVPLCGHATMTSIFHNHFLSFHVTVSTSDGSHKRTRCLCVASIFYNHILYISREPFQHQMVHTNERSASMWHQYFTTTFYIFPGNRFNIRWFTPPNEVPLCGHATMTSIFHNHFLSFHVTVSTSDGSHKRTRCLCVASIFYNHILYISREPFQHQMVHTNERGASMWPCHRGVSCCFIFCT